MNIELTSETKRILLFNIFLLRIYSSKHFYGKYELDKKLILKNVLWQLLNAFLFSAIFICVSGLLIAIIFATIGNIYGTIGIILSVIVVVLIFATFLFLSKNDDVRISNLDLKSWYKFEFDQEQTMALFGHYDNSIGNNYTSNVVVIFLNYNSYKKFMDMLFFHEYIYNGYYEFQVNFKKENSCLSVAQNDFIVNVNDNILLNSNYVYDICKYLDPVGIAKFGQTNKTIRKLLNNTECNNKILHFYKINNYCVVPSFNYLFGKTVSEIELNIVQDYNTCYDIYFSNRIRVIELKVFSRYVYYKAIFYETRKNIFNKINFKNSESESEIKSKFIQNEFEKSFVYKCLKN